MARHQSDILENALMAGERMPGFTLQDTQGQAVWLARLLLRGPVVVSFFRGDWCDYCAMELAALSADHDQVKALGASLVGISPQAPEARIRCVGPEPPFPLLFNAGAKLAQRCRIEVTFDRMMDDAIVADEIEVQCSDGTRFDAVQSLIMDGRKLVFHPAGRWDDSDYRLVLSRRLEDVCGNRLGEALDHLVSQRQRSRAGVVSFRPAS